MIKGVFSESSSWFKFLFTLFVIVISLTVFVFIGFIVSLLIFDINIAKVSSSLDINNPNNINFLKFFQAIQSIGMFVLPPFIIAFLFSKDNISYLKINKKIKWDSVIIASLIIITGLPIINFLVEINSHLKLPEFLSGIEEMMRESEKSAEILTKKFLSVDNISGLIVNLVIVALIPAIGEELLFRAVLLKIFIDWTKNIHLAALISAILFSALHFQFFGFLPRMLLGVYLAYLMIWSKSIWLPIVIHFINNGLAVVAFYFQEKNMIGNKLETIGTSKDMLFYTFISIIIVSGLLYFLYRKKEY